MLLIFDIAILFISVVIFLFANFCHAPIATLGRITNLDRKQIINNDIINENPEFKNQVRDGLGPWIAGTYINYFRFFSGVTFFILIVNITTLFRLLEVTTSDKLIMAIFYPSFFMAISVVLFSLYMVGHL